MLPSVLSSARTQLAGWRNSAACSSPPICLLSVDVSGSAHPAPRACLRACWALRGAFSPGKREAVLGLTLHCLSLEITCVSAWFGSSLCSNALHCILFLSITRTAIFIPFSSYYFHIINFFFFELPPHSQPSPLRESLKRKENIIQTLHITRDVVVQSRLVLLSVKITELVYSPPSPWQPSSSLLPECADFTLVLNRVDVDCYLPSKNDIDIN